jgi:ketosteroid isomerase-like protein
MYVLVVAGVLADAACSGSTRADTAAARDSATPAAAASCGATDAINVRRTIDSTMAHAGAELRRTGDMEILWALYADDTIFMWDNQRMWRGKAEARREAPKALGDLSFKDAKETVEDVIVCGDLAVEVGTFEHTLQRKSGEVITNRGKNLKAWRRQPDGSWRIVRNLGNDDAPLQR